MVNEQGCYTTSAAVDRYSCLLLQQHNFCEPGEAGTERSISTCQGMGLSGPIDPSASAGESSQRYAARMVYLTEDDEGAIFGNTTLEPMGRTLKPPGLFMSRHQARADSALCAVRSI